MARHWARNKIELKLKQGFRASHFTPAYTHNQSLSLERLYVNLHANNVWKTRVFQAEHLGVPVRTPWFSKRNILVFQATSIGNHLSFPKQEWSVFSPLQTSNTATSSTSGVRRKRKTRPQNPCNWNFFSTFAPQINPFQPLLKQNPVHKTLNNNKIEHLGCGLM